ncbi:hypothetical protein H0A65_10845 [Alcaligenaceae bacterium]|nr:hypothetical protein [Alcaligenaceae bacterium]
MTLIPNWRKSWRMFSQWAFVVAGALQGAWLMLDAQQKASIPSEWVTYITIGIMVLGFVGRLVYQPKVNK